MVNEKKELLITVSINVTTNKGLLKTIAAVKNGIYYGLDTNSIAPTTDVKIKTIPNGRI